MAAVTKFEDLIAWQEARKLMRLAYQVSSDGAFAKVEEKCLEKSSSPRQAITNEIARET